MVSLPLSDILPMRRVPDSTKQTARYKRIVASIDEVGIVEPLVVARRGKDEGPYMLVDGHLRHAALLDLGTSEAPCLIADDDEAFTYNKRVNRLATIQEHYMIVKAIERGVSEGKLAKALNVDIKRIKTKRTLLDGVCPEVADMLKDKSVDAEVFSLLRKMKAMRQIEAVELMSAMNNFTARYARADLASSPASCSKAADFKPAAASLLALLLGSRARLQRYEGYHISSERSMILKWSAGPEGLRYSGYLSSQRYPIVAPKWIEREIVVPEKAASRSWLDVEPQGRHNERRATWLRSRALPISVSP